MEKNTGFSTNRRGLKFTFGHSLTFIRRDDGFTLVELLVTLALAAILMGFAVPSMISFVKNDRLVTQINTLTGDLAYARSESVLRHEAIVVCASNNQTGCNSSNWANGWIVFVDDNNDGGKASTEEMLRQNQGFPGDSKLSASMGKSVVFNRRGFAPDSVGSFVLCDDRGDAHVKSISISATGRVSRGTATSC
jgi:type IV fimbrial biogenesis protein FimT